MAQREITDNDNITWTCVQAYSGSKGKAAEKAAQLAVDENGQVAVVCTPSGGAQSVRLQLNTDWLEQLSDEQLMEKIVNQQE